MKTKSSIWSARVLLLAGLVWIPSLLDAAQQIDMKAAQKEGSVTIYSSISIEDVTALAKVFEKAYSGIKVEIYRAGKIKLGQRMILITRFCSSFAYHGATATN